jgi:hypothetical protein
MRTADRLMARDYLSERYTEAQLALQLERMQLAAERLVASEKDRDRRRCFVAVGHVDGRRNHRATERGDGKLGALKRRTSS